MDDAYFMESVSDGISNAIDEYDAGIECTNQDGYELIVMTFGKGVSADSFRNASNADFEAFGKNMLSYFELDKEPEKKDVEAILKKALSQWKG